MYLFSNLRLRTLGLLTVLVVLAGCAGMRETTRTDPSGALPPAFPGHSAAAIQRLVRTAGDSIRAFKAEGAIDLQSPQQEGSYGVRIRQRRNDSLLVALSPGWGIVAARGLATADSVFLYDRFHHQLYYGSINAVQELLPALTSLSDLFATLTGTLAPDPSLDWSVRADSSRYYLEAVDGFRRYTYVVDPRLWRVVRYEVRTREGQLIAQRLFSNFRSVNGVYVPHRVIVRRPIRDTRLILQYDHITPNPGNLAFPFPEDPTIKRIPIKVTAGR